MNQVVLSNVRSMMSALASMDQMLGFPDRRARFKTNPTDERVMFMYGQNYDFDSRERLELDIAMARFHGVGTMLTPCGSKFDDNVITVLQNANYAVNRIVCVGDNVSSWVVVGKHFVLEFKNTKFD